MSLDIPYSVDIILKEKEIAKIFCVLVYVAQQNLTHRLQADVSPVARDKINFQNKDSLPLFIPNLV